MRRHYSDSFKAEVVLELLKEEKTVAQIASERHIHPNQIHEWRTLVLRDLATLFGQVRGFYLQLGEIPQGDGRCSRVDGLHARGDLTALSYHDFVTQACYTHPC